MARKFLITIAVLIGMVILAGLAWTLFAQSLIRAAMVPTADYIEQSPMEGNAYADKALWFARPDLQGNPAEWLPTGTEPAKNRRAAVFFIHPTSYLDRRRWNAPLDDAASQDLAQTFLRGQASTFNAVGDVWAPRYRQATFGAFLTTQAEATKALDAAYRDVAVAFDAFVAAQPADRPIVLAGHSQGALHLTRLLRERIAGKPIADRIVAAYVVGWPVSIERDLAALGLPPCTHPDAARCILSWQSFAEPADASQVIAAYDATIGFDGKSRRDTKMLCVNPLTGGTDGEAEAGTNQGSLIPDLNLKNATLVVGRIPARCDARGFLLIGAPPEGIGAYILPGNNYHVFDYSLFWANVRSDVARRLLAFEKR